MNDWKFDLGLSFLFTIIRSSVKNKQAKKDMKKAFLKLFNAIRDLYAGDPDFQ